MYKKVLVIGHRGARGHEPENTLISFKKGIELGCDYIEFDVQLTKDKIPIIFHDYKLEKRTEEKGKISETTLKNIQKVKFKGQKIPAVKEALQKFKKTNFLIEIKGKQDVQNICEVIKKNSDKKNEHIIISFFPKNIQDAKSIMPNVKTGLLIKKITGIFQKIKIIDKIKQAKELDAELIIPHHSIITKKFIKEAHKNKLKVFTYTLNNPKKMKKLIDYEIDGIITDYPKRVFKILSQKNLRKTEEE